MPYAWGWVKIGSLGLTQPSALLLMASLSTSLIVLERIVTYFFARCIWLQLELFELLAYNTHIKGEQ